MQRIERREGGNIHLGIKNDEASEKHHVQARGKISAQCESVGDIDFGMGENLFGDCRDPFLR